MAPQTRNRPTTESAASSASRTAPVDVSALAFEDTDTPTRAGSAAAPDPAYVKQIEISMATRKNRPTADNPNAWVGKGRGVTVARSQVPSVTAAVRNAAESLGAGATFSYYVDNKQVKPADVLGVPASRDGKRAAVAPTLAANTKVLVSFAAKSPKKKRTPAQTPASDGE
jgi:hypothetical protein